MLLRLGVRPRPRLAWAAGDRPPPGRELQALNATMVGVGVEEEEEEEDGGSGGGGSSSGSSSEEDECDAASAGEALPPMAGLALVRAADAEDACLYLVAPPAVAAALRDQAAAAASSAGGPGQRARRARFVLQAGGPLELPPALLHWGGGGSAGASPYLAPWCLAGVGTGARAQASRNDLARAGQQQ
jgi:hypothetical protein